MHYYGHHYPNSHMINTVSKNLDCILLYAQIHNLQSFININIIQILPYRPLSPSQTNNYIKPI